MATKIKNGDQNQDDRLKRHLSGYFKTLLVRKMLSIDGKKHFWPFPFYRGNPTRWRQNLK
jgi:hypothetical protein